MKKSVLMLMAVCFMSAPALAKDGKSDKLNRKIAEIKQEYREDVREIESKDKLSAEMKRLRLEQEERVKDLKIKQAKEMYDLKTRQKTERRALKEKEMKQIGVEESFRPEKDGMENAKKFKKGRHQKGLK